MARDGRTGERANGRANEGVLRGPRRPKNVVPLGLCQNGVLAPYCRTENPDTQKTYPSASDFHEYHSDTPRQPPDIPQTPPRHLQGARNANRRQQTPIDTARHTQTAPVSVLKCLAVSVGICWRLLACFVPWRCLGGCLWDIWGLSGVVFMDIRGAWMCLGGIWVLSPAVWSQNTILAQPLKAQLVFI